MSTNIRKAEPRDAARLADLIRTSFRDVALRFGLTPENAPTHPSNCTADWIVAALEKGAAYFILERDGRPCGCAALEKARPGVGYLERLAVRPEDRRQGLGAALVGRVIEEAARIGIQRVEIGLIAAQTELMDWYRGLGFVRTGTRRFEHLPFEVAFMFASSAGLDRAGGDVMLEDDG